MVTSFIQSLQILCTDSNTRPSIKLADVEGIEPSPTDLETVVLPLHQTNIKSPTRSITTCVSLQLILTFRTKGIVQILQRYVSSICHDAAIRACDAVGGAEG